MKTLIIHPKDYTTDFLEPIYYGLNDKTVLREDFSMDHLSALIENHDRVLMMGHGSPNGLFSMGLTTDHSTFVIDNRLVEILAKKSNNVFIWCHADVFVRSNNLKGFSTGMFISEPLEALLYKVQVDSKKQIEVSNTSFAAIVSKSILVPQEEMHLKVQQQYRAQNIENPVAVFNASRLFLFQ